MCESAVCRNGQSFFNTHPNFDANEFKKIMLTRLLQLAGKGYHYPVPVDDAQRAIRLVRADAAKWNIDPAKIGVMGFSAGGHLASTVGTHFDPGKKDAADKIDGNSSRPDFLILCYPVIS